MSLIFYKKVGKINHINNSSLHFEKRNINEDPAPRAEKSRFPIASESYVAHGERNTHFTFAVERKRTHLVITGCEFLFFFFLFFCLSYRMKSLNLGDVINSLWELSWTHYVFSTSRSNFDNLKHVRFFKF